MGKGRRPLPAGGCPRPPRGGRVTEELGRGCGKGSRNLRLGWAWAGGCSGRCVERRILMAAVSRGEGVDPTCSLAEGCSLSFSRLQF